jgi:hypothetical protein
VAVVERPVPRPSPGEMRDELDHCGICGSDIHLLHEGWVGDRFGLVAGHEFTGRIVAFGEEAAAGGSATPWWPAPHLAAAVAGAALLLELTVNGSFVYDHDGFERRSSGTCCP